MKAKIDDEDWRDLGSFVGVLSGFGKARTYCRSGLTREALSEYRRVERMLAVLNNSEH